MNANTTEPRDWTTAELQRMPDTQFRHIAVRVNLAADPDLWELLTEEDLREKTAIAYVHVRAHITRQLDQRAAEIGALAARTNSKDPRQVTHLQTRRTEYSEWRARATAFFFAVRRLIAEFERATGLNIDTAARGEAVNRDGIVTVTGLAKAIAAHRDAATAGGQPVTDHDRALWKALEGLVDRERGAIPVRVLLERLAAPAA